jgi:Tfp pilus assembly protein PilE
MSVLTRLAAERGSSLIELVAATAILAVVMGAVFGAFTVFERTGRVTEAQNDTQDRARRGVSRLARDLRNMASPTPAQPQALEVAEPYQIVFQTVDPIGPNAGQNSSNVRRVRYCLDDANPSDATVWAQTQTWTTPEPPPLPSTDGCPNTAWGGKELMAYGVTNTAGGRDAPVFTYGSGPIAEVSSVRTELYVRLPP